MFMISLYNSEFPEILVNRLYETNIKSNSDYIKFNSRNVPWKTF